MKCKAEVLRNSTWKKILSGVIRIWRKTLRARVFALKFTSYLTNVKSEGSHHPSLSDPRCLTLNLLANRLPGEASRLKDTSHRQYRDRDRDGGTCRVRTVLFSLNTWCAMARDAREVSTWLFATRLLRVALLISPVVSAADDDVWIGHRCSDSACCAPRARRRVALLSSCQRRPRRAA